jgi:hypothetical protein
MEFTMTVHMRGSAFDPEVSDPSAELARILRKAAGQVEQVSLPGGGEGGAVLDLNGNLAGSWVISDE